MPGEIIAHGASGVCSQCIMGNDILSIALHGETELNIYKHLFFLNKAKKDDTG